MEEFQGMMLIRTFPCQVSLLVPSKIMLPRYDINSDMVVAYYGQAFCEAGEHFESICTTFCRCGHAAHHGLWSMG
jgi:hypothetical protein